jgi:ureidoacrylate peracid hydrolase
MDFDVKVDPRHSAVLVVDMQNDFCRPGAAYAKAVPGIDFAPIEQMVPRLSTFLDSARKAGCQVIYVISTYNSKEGDFRYMSEAWLEHAERGRRGMYVDIPLCQEESWGAQVVEELQPRPDEMLLVKHRYSAFLDTSLAQYLRNNQLRTVIVTGVGTNGCVESTARDAFMLDFFLVVAEDCVTTFWQDLHENSLRNMRIWFGEVRPSAEIVSAWQPRTSTDERLRGAQGSARRGNSASVTASLGRGK